MNSLIHHVKKSLELHKWCSLRFSLKLEQNASASATSNENFIISNLIDLCGWIKKASDFISSLEEEEEEEVDSDSVSNLFRRRCCISKNITCYPRLLKADDAEKTLDPKHEFIHFRELQAALSTSTMISLETFPTGQYKPRCIHFESFRRAAGVNCH